MVQTYISADLAKILGQIRKSKYPLAKLSTIVQEYIVKYLLNNEELLKEVFKEADIKKIKKQLKDMELDKKDVES